MVGRKIVVLLIKVRFLVFPQLKKEGSLAELVDCDGLENHWARNCSVGSNPTASAKKKNEETFGKYKQKLYNKNVKSSLKRLTNM